MRAKLFVVLESVFLGLGLLILTPSVNPRPIAKASTQTIRSNNNSANGVPAVQSKKKGPGDHAGAFLYDRSNAFGMKTLRVKYLE